MMFANRVIAIDHVAGTTHLLALGAADDPAPARWLDEAELVVREALVVASAGLAAGLAFALAAGRAARSTLDPILFGLTPHDPVVLSASVALLLFVAVLAALVPARTAAHVDPVVALRGD